MDECTLEEADNPGNGRIQVLPHLQTLRVSYNLFMANVREVAKDYESMIA